MKYRATFYLPDPQATRDVARCLSFLREQQWSACSIQQRRGQAPDTWIVGTGREVLDQEPSSLVAFFACDSAAQLRRALRTTHLWAARAHALAFKVETTPDPEPPLRDDLLHFNPMDVPMFGLSSPRGDWFAQFQAHRCDHHGQYLHTGQQHTFQLWEHLCDPAWPDSAPPSTHSLEPDILEMSLLEEDMVERWQDALPWVEGDKLWFGEFGQQYTLAALPGDIPQAVTCLVETLYRSGWRYRDITPQSPALWVVPATRRAHAEAHSATHLEELLHQGPSLPSAEPAYHLMSASLEQLGVICLRRGESQLLLQPAASDTEVFVSAPGLYEGGDTPDELQSALDALQAALTSLA